MFLSLQTQFPACSNLKSSSPHSVWQAHFHTLTEMFLHLVIISTSVCRAQRKGERLEQCVRLFSFFFLCLWVKYWDWLVWCFPTGMGVKSCATFYKVPVTFFNTEMRKQNKTHEWSGLIRLFLYRPLMYAEEREKSWIIEYANMLGSGWWRRGWVKYTGKASGGRLDCDERERSGSKTREWATDTAR